MGRAGRGGRRPSQAARRPRAGGLRHELDFDGTDSTFPFGAHVSVVEVDTETGQVELLRHVAVDDCGRILNPLLVAGQQHGGIAQGAAQALYEGSGTTTTATRSPPTSLDYAMPSAAELPQLRGRRTPQTDSPRNPLGAKGIGESGTIGSTPAIQNAVVDAVSHLGVKPHRHARAPRARVAGDPGREDVQRSRRVVPVVPVGLHRFPGVLPTDTPGLGS